MKKLLLTLAFLLLVPFSASALTFDENMCQSYGATAANITIVLEQGATYQDILKLLDNQEFKELPKEIQELVKTTAEFLSTVGSGATPEENFQGASGFCMKTNGDVSLMIQTLKKVMGTSI